MCVTHACAPGASDAAVGVAWSAIAAFGKRSPLARHGRVARDERGDPRRRGGGGGGGRVEALVRAHRVGAQGPQLLRRLGRQRLADKVDRPQLAAERRWRRRRRAAADAAADGARGRVAERQRLLGLAVDVEGGGGARREEAPARRVRQRDVVPPAGLEDVLEIGALGGLRAVGGAEAEARGVERLEGRALGGLALKVRVDQRARRVVAEPKEARRPRRVVGVGRGRVGGRREALDPQPAVEGPAGGAQRHRRHVDGGGAAVADKVRGGPRLAEHPRERAQQLRVEERVAVGGALGEEAEEQLELGDRHRVRRKRRERRQERGLQRLAARRRELLQHALPQADGGAPRAVEHRRAEERAEPREQQRLQRRRQVRQQRQQELGERRRLHRRRRRVGPRAADAVAFVAVVVAADAGGSVGRVLREGVEEQGDCALVGRAVGGGEEELEQLVEADRAGEVVVRVRAPPQQRRQQPQQRAAHRRGGGAARRAVDDGQGLDEDAAVAQQPLRDRLPVGSRPEERALGGDDGGGGAEEGALQRRRQGGRRERADVSLVELGGARPRRARRAVDGAADLRLERALDGSVAQQPHEQGEHEAAGGAVGRPPRRVEERERAGAHRRLQRPPSDDAGAGDGVERAERERAPPASDADAAAEGAATATATAGAAAAARSASAAAAVAAAAAASAAAVAASAAAVAAAVGAPPAATRARAAFAASASAAVAAAAACASVAAAAARPTLGGDGGACGKQGARSTTWSSSPNASVHASGAGPAGASGAPAAAPARSARRATSQSARTSGAAAPRCRGAAAGGGRGARGRRGDR